MMALTGKRTRLKQTHFSPIEIPHGFEKTKALKNRNLKNKSLQEQQHCRSTWKQPAGRCGLPIL
jgi:hypothetical protein